MSARLASMFAIAIVAPQAAAQPQQIQLDGGLSVIGLGYERAVTPHIALGVELITFGSYFLPWFDLGVETLGVGVGLRPTWFAREDQRGIYVTPYLRGVVVDDDSFTGATGLGFTAGVFIGWAFRLSDHLDLRIGGGAQYLHAHVETSNGRESFGTPFVALDAVLGYRL